MDKSFFTQQVNAKIERLDLNETIPNQLYLIAEYNIDINEVSTSAPFEQQKYVEKLFLTVLYLMSILDQAYIDELHNPEHNIPDLENQFFSALEALPAIAMESLGYGDKEISNEVVASMSSSIYEVNKKISEDLETWFLDKRTALKGLFEGSLRHKDKSTIAESIIQCIYHWRSTYIQSKQEKVNTALSNIENIPTPDKIDDITEISDDEKKVLLRPHLFYSPFYSLSHIEYIPMELALNITMILDKIEPKLSSEELLKIEESNNIYVIEYLKLINVAERDRNKFLHTLNTFSDYFTNRHQTLEKVAT